MGIAPGVLRGIGTRLARDRATQAIAAAAIVSGGVVAAAHAFWPHHGSHSTSGPEPAPVPAPVPAPDHTPGQGTSPSAPGAPNTRPIASTYVQLAEDVGIAPGRGSTPAQFTASERTTGPGWLAADMGWSVRLPDGREAFFYGDTVTGQADGTGMVTHQDAFLRNSIVVQNGTHRTTLATRASDGSLHAPLGADAEPDGWSWPGAPVVDGGHVRLVTASMRKTDSGAQGWNFAATGFRLVTLSATDLAPESSIPLGTRSDISWGSGMVVDGDHEVISGTKQDGFGQDIFLARVPRPGHDGSFEVWNGRTWTTDETQATKLTTGIGAQLLKTKSGWAMLGQAGVFGPVLTVRTAHRLTGPWSDARIVGTVPQSVAQATSGAELLYTPTAHPELSSGGRVLVSTSVNASDGELHPELDRYRPRWTTIPASALEPQP